jgi:TonB family protein
LEAVVGLNGRAKWAAPFLISLGVHGLILLCAAPITKSTHKSKPIKVTLLGKNNSVKPKVKKPEIEKEVVKKKEEKKEEEDLKGQVVDLPPDYNSERPENAEFLSETDHKVERETISRHRSLSNEQSGHEKTKAHDIKDSGAKNLGTDNETQEEQRKRELPKIKERERLALKKDNDGTIKNEKGSDRLDGDGESLHLGQHDKDAKKSNKGAKELKLFPDERVISKIASAPFADAVEDVDEGEGTFLNTFAFKYAIFYNRVKRDVANRWHPMVELRRRDPTGNIYGHRNRKTVLDIILDKEGRVLSATVRSSCGVDFLDKEAINSFRRVRQFPNPPSGLIKDGRVRFNFGFEVSFNRRTLF